MVMGVRPFWTLCRLELNNPPGRITHSQREGGFRDPPLTTMDSQQRAELIAVLHQVTSFAEALLEVNERLLGAISGKGDRPTEADLAYMRAGLEQWREQLAGVRQRIGSLTVEPPTRPQ